MKTVMAFGSFDILHPGHLYFLNQAKSKGDKLVVVIALDKTIEKVKGEKPKYNERQRLEHVKGMPMVDKAVLGYEKDPYEIIEEINPDVICLGYDQDSYSENLKEKLAERGINPEIIRLGPYKEDIYKSSKLKQHLQ
ncbi:FAD synthase [Candidatus Woesearchaeota archaeon]|nr:FAD synthase [Candidatus Woesearchaeota archaeon]